MEAFRLPIWLQGSRFGWPKEAAPVAAVVGRPLAVSGWNLKEGKPKPPGGRVTFATWQFYDKDEPLVASGLLGPVRLRATAMISPRGLLLRDAHQIVHRFSLAGRFCLRSALELAEPLLDYLDNCGTVQLLGKRHCRDGDRAPTIAFRPLRQSSAQLAANMQADGIGTESGNFYAPRALTHMGIDPGDGIVRISLLHYNTVVDVEKILVALDRTL